MRKHSNRIFENRIEFWPYYEAGMAGSIVLIVIGTLYVATAIWILLEETATRETRLLTQVVLPIAVVALSVALRWIIHLMHTKIVVSNIGIEFFVNETVTQNCINWEDVAEVYFYQDNWYGTRACRIFLKKTISQKSTKAKKCDFAFSVCSVDEGKLLQFIPDYLWKNKPWY